jgi:HlyD family secretion protein
MDIPRPSQAKAKRRRLILIISGITVAVVGISIFLSRLEPAAPTVDKQLVWLGTVQRGPMVRQVRGLGTLVPVEIRWIAARTAGRVERIVLRPGAIVKGDSVILELTNPDVEQAALAAESQLGAGQTELTRLAIQLQSELLAMESTLAGAKSNFETSRLQAEVNADLYKDGLVAELELRRAQVAAEEAATRYEIEKKRYDFSKDSIEPQLAVKRAEVARLEAQAKLKRADVDALLVRAWMDGVLQQLPVEVGQQVQPGTNLARVADPTLLKAEVRIAETQAKDILIGQSATIDTRNGVVVGEVSRIDPAVQNGTVTVDVKITGDLPRGARPDLSVDGVIELDRLEDVIFVGRPAFGQESSSVGIYKLSPDETRAQRVQVQLGKASVNTIEVVSGLVPGDRVILSDMSPYEDNDRLRLR